MHGGIYSDISSATYKELQEIMEDIEIKVGPGEASMVEDDRLTVDLKLNTRAREALEMKGHLSVGCPSGTFSRSTRMPRW